jgi:FkbM family methyltransferase
MNTNYDWAIDRILTKHPNLVKRGAVIAEIGSRDALDAIGLAEKLGGTVYVFEPDPINRTVCKENIKTKGVGLALEFYEIALCSENKEIDFLSVDPDLYGNRGASGIFQINFSNRTARDPDYRRESVQRPVNVAGRRFDSLGCVPPELVCMDVQGAELEVLIGFGNMINEVKVIILESSMSENYIGGSTFADVDAFLESKNFTLDHTDQFGDKRPKQGWLSALMKWHAPDFNCIYLNKRYAKIDR